MRIRSTKPEFWRSERIASVSWDARLVLKGLESYVDDNGVGKDDIALIVSDIFPRDHFREPSRTLARVSEAISDLSGAGLVWRYEADGNKLLFVAFWDAIQRIDKPSAGRLPRPDGTMSYRESEIRESLASPREDSGGFPPGTGEQGTGEQGTVQEKTSSAELTVRPTKYPSEFEEFWVQYPRKVGKDAALKVWQQAKRRVSTDEIQRGVERLAADPNLPDPNYIPHAATWLKRGGWDDAPYPPPRNGNRAMPTADARVVDGLNMAQRLAAEEAAAEQANYRMEIEA